ncbi:MAG: hypothetical protein C0514_03835 [Candidatus Puniceispirillum sp.]|nr:hypothetical protein [Candidatus Puniceispirillum sp.]
MGRHIRLLGIILLLWGQGATNAALASFAVSHFTSPRGDSVRVGHWPAAAPHKQTLTLVFLQGRGSFLEKNEALMETFAGLGFDTYAIDLPGQGGSTRLLPGTQKGHVDDFERYLSAIDAFIQDKKNVLLVGVSLGGHLALRAGYDAPPNIKGIVAIVPMIDVYTDNYPKWSARAMCSTMVRLGFGTRYAPGKGDFNPRNYLFETNDETSDPVRFSELRTAMLTHKDLISGGPTCGWINEAYKSMDHLQDAAYLARITPPVLLVTAGADTIVDTRFDASSCARMARCQHKVIEGARHNIPYEKDALRTSLLHAMMDFVKTLEAPHK